MRVLVIGGTGFIGPFVIKTLVDQGHDLTVFHRGEAKPELPESVHRIHGNRNDLTKHRAIFDQLAPDVVLDFILSDRPQAAALMETFRGLTARVVAISSQDVYRAYGVLIGREPGPPQPTPLTEESEVRRQLHPYNVEHLRTAQAAFPWITEDYDKIPVEQTVLGDSALPGTVLRLPMVYGPGDPLHRFFPTLKRIAVRPSCSKKATRVCIRRADMWKTLPRPSHWQLSPAARPEKSTTSQATSNSPSSNGRKKSGR